MATIHISETEAIQDFAGLLARVRAGEEVVIDGEAAPSVTMHAMDTQAVRPISEVLRRVRERGSSVTLDDQFGKDMESVLAVSYEVPFPTWD